MSRRTTKQRLTPQRRGGWSPWRGVALTADRFWRSTYTYVNALPPLPLSLEMIERAFEALRLRSE